MGTMIRPREGEKVLFTIRKSLFRLFKPILKFLIIFVISLLGIIFSPNDIVTIVAVGIFLFSLTYALYYVLLWFYDVYIITNLRLVCVEQRGLFSKEFAEVELAKIKDVTYQIRGVFATLFKFGTVKIKSEDYILELDSLSDPDEVQEMLKRLSENAQANNRQPKMSAEELIDFIVKNHKK